MKKGIMIVLAIVLVVIAGIYLLTAPARTNKQILRNLLRDFSDTISQHSQENPIEIKGVYGKLNGNGNGIAFFGAALVNKDTVSDMDALLAALDADFETVGILEQDGRKVVSEYLQHKTLYFNTHVQGGGPAITIYFYTTHPNSNPNDPAGH
ncbi:MAG: hypothetical protein IJ403_01175 [Oscillospiraceae bacterium]|nr:hypothetical protein [Oscillospiraceae bacterium]